MNRCVKYLAQQFRLDPAQFSTRSLRVGAATTLSVEGKSKADIDTAVGRSQRSHTATRYARLTPNLDNAQTLSSRGLAIMQAATNLTKQVVPSRR